MHKTIFHIRVAGAPRPRREPATFPTAREGPVHYPPLRGRCWDALEVSVNISLRLADFPLQNIHLFPGIKNKTNKLLLV
jgi:hypothetical protein